MRRAYSFFACFLLKLSPFSAFAEDEEDGAAGLEAGEYYVSVTAKNTKANEKGGAFYNVTATFNASGSAASSLAMPEISDSLAITDALGFASLDSDALASASASSLAELDDKTGWQSLLA